MWKLAFIVSCIVLAGDPAGAWRNFEVRLRDITCKHNPKYLKYVDCSIRRGPPKDLSALSYQLELYNASALHDITLQITLILKTGAEMKMVDVQMDTCNFLRTGSKNLIIKMVLERLQQPNVSNMNCHFESNTPYYVRNLVIDPEKLPPYSPHLGFFVFMQFSDADKSTLNIAISGEIEDSRRA